MFHIHVCIHSFPQANNKLAAWSIPANSCPIAPRMLSTPQVAHRPVQCYRDHIVGQLTALTLYTAGRISAILGTPVQTIRRHHAI